MRVDEYIGKIIEDEEKRKYHIISVVGEGGQGFVLRSSEGFLIKINTSVDRDNYVERYRWLMKKATQLPRETRIALPIAILAKPYVGYVMKEVLKSETLEFYMEQSEETSDFVDWYYKYTNGLTKRLLIGQWIAKALRYLHINGCAYVDLSPKNILVCKEKNSIALIDSDNITSGIYRPLIKGTDFYMAPEIANERSIANSLSDTYSFAIILFKLLTACHPFIGDEAEDANPELLCKKVNSGEVGYIGDPYASNKNSNYENMKDLLSDELKGLFMRMFVDGRMIPEKRPTLMEFIKALKHARYITIQCTNEECSSEYLYTGKDCRCPVCNEKADKVYEISSMNMVKGDKKIIFPLKEKGEERRVFTGTEDKENTLYLTKKNKTITSSFFDEGISFENEKNMIVFGRSKSGGLLVANHCASALTIYDRDFKCKRKIDKYIEGKTEPTVIEMDSMIFLAPNMDLSLEAETIDMDSMEELYGKIEITRFLKVTEA